MARKAEDVGVAKAALPASKLVALAVLAGAFISVGALFSMTVSADGDLTSGIARPLSGLVFSLGLILVIVSGAELFTGNAMVIMAVASKRVTVPALLRNWGLVYVGNTVGAVATATLVRWSGRLGSGDGSLAARAVSIAQAKTHLGWGEAVVSGVLANALVCLAVWMSLSARTVGDKVVAIVGPIAAFVAIGFEHSIANLFFIPLGMMVDGDAATWGALVWRNIAPVTLGNVIGGGGLVAGFYWFIYRGGVRTD
jgi:formate/nitrite transporter